MGLEAVATVETLAAEITVDQTAWRGYVNVQKYHPKKRLSGQCGHFSNYYINSDVDPYPIGSGTFCQVRSGSGIVVPDPDL